MNLETKITIYKFTPQLFTLTLDLHGSVKPRVKPRMKATVNEALTLKNPSLMYQKTFHWN